VARTAPAAQALDSLTKLALRSGSQAKLPPNLVAVLGLGVQIAGLPVRQLVLRAGAKARVFNVSVANHSDLVILNHDEAAHVTSAYLLSPQGKLRTAVSYEDGHESRPTPAARARPRFASEIQYWSAISQSIAAQR
jgi:hypothetical protein